MPNEELLKIGVPRPPRRPTDKAKELIYKYQGTQGIMLYIGVSFLIMGILFSGLFYGDAVLDLIVDLTKAETQGTIRGIDIDDSGDDFSEIEFYYTAEGRRYADTSLSDDYNKVSDYRNGDTVTIEYSVLNPGLARIKGLRISVMPFWRAFVLLFPVMGFFLTLAAVRSNAREKKAYRYGIPVIAQIESKGYDYSASSNGKHPYRIIWRFEKDGRFYSGELTHMNPETLLDLIIDRDTDEERLLVVYLEQNPRINVPYV